MKRKNTNSTAVSEVVSVILVIALVLVLAMVVYILLFGSIDQKYLKKSVYVAGDANIGNILQPSGLNDQVLTFMPKAGDPFYLTGQNQNTKGTQVTLKILSPDGKILSPDASGLSGALYGKTLFLYPNSSPSSTVCDLAISDKVPSGYLRPMVTGRYTIQLIDEQTHVLANSFTTTIKQGTTSLPVAGGFITPGKIYRSDCTLITSNTTGSLPTSPSGPGNMTFTTFNGASFMAIKNDPSLSFTGDMAISLWMRPTTAGDPNNPSSWHQILGKGAISGSSENDNYQLFQMGNKLVFEWNDATNPTIHYQAITQNPTVTAGNWNYVTASISGGKIQIYNNGQLQDLVYSQGVDPRSIVTPFPNPPVVKLQSTPNDVTVGKQNGGSGSEFYYTGDIGATSLYNRGLTLTEISSNNATYTA
jgi:FlaG/FlaF family flagellin (archaellin)